MALDTIGSIATHIAENFPNLPAGVSGNLVETVDMSRQHVANWIGGEIGSNSIAAEFQPPIVSFSKADTIDLVNAQIGGDKLRLAELTIDASGDIVSSEFWKVMGDKQLSAIGRKVQFQRSIS